MRSDLVFEEEYRKQKQSILATPRASDKAKEKEESKRVRQSDKRQRVLQY